MLDENFDRQIEVGRKRDRHVVGKCPTAGHEHQRCRHEIGHTERFVHRNRRRCALARGPGRAGQRIHRQAEASEATTTTSRSDHDQRRGGRCSTEKRTMQEHQHPLKERRVHTSLSRRATIGSSVDGPIARSPSPVENQPATRATRHIPTTCRTVARPN